MRLVFNTLAQLTSSVYYAQIVIDHNYKHRHCYEKRDMKIKFKSTLNILRYWYISIINLKNCLLNVDYTVTSLNRIACVSFISLLIVLKCSEINERLFSPLRKVTITASLSKLLIRTY
jgi:hypothetical protein